MKKVLSVLMVAVALMMAVPAQAQLIKFGVKGGANLSKVSFSKSDFNGDNRTGWFIGPMAEVTLPIVGLGVDVAALYSQTELSGEYDNTDINLKTIEVPVNLKWSFGFGSTLGAYLAAGPQFGFNVGSKGDKFWDLKESITTFNVGAGLKLIKHLQLGINYNFALGKFGEYDGGSLSSDSSNKISEVKNKTWQVSLAYIF